MEVKDANKQHQQQQQQNNVSNNNINSTSNTSSTTSILTSFTTTSTTNNNLISKDSKLDLETNNNNNNNNNNNSNIVNSINNTPTKQLLIAELDSSTTHPGITPPLKSSELRLSELNSSDISTDSSNNNSHSSIYSSTASSTSSSLFSSLPAGSSFQTLHQHQQNQQQQQLFQSQRSLNRRSFDPASISSLNLINSGATTPPSKLARTLSSIALLSNKKKENYSRHTFPGGHLNHHNSYSPSSGVEGVGSASGSKVSDSIPLDINSLVNSGTTATSTTTKLTTATSNTNNNNNTQKINNNNNNNNKNNNNINKYQPTTPVNTSSFQSNDDSIDQISPHFTRRPSSLIVGAFPAMTPQQQQQLDFETNGRTTPDEELSEQNKFYKRIEENPDGFITIQEIRSILSCYDTDAIDQIISGIPFENGICLNRDFLELVQEFQQTSQYEDADLMFEVDDYDTKNHPINNLMDFKVEDIEQQQQQQQQRINSTTSITLGDDSDGGSEADSSNNTSSVGYLQKPRRFDFSIPPSYGEFVDNGSVNGSGISSREYLEMQSELNKLKNEAGLKDIEVKKRIKLEEDLHLLQAEITTKEEENTKLRRENQNLSKIDKRHKELSNELEKSKERDNKSKAEIDKLKKRNQRNDDELKKIKNEKDVIQQREEDALKTVEEKETDIKRLKRDNQKLENLLKELEENYQLSNQHILELKQKEEQYMVQHQNNQSNQQAINEFSSKLRTLHSLFSDSTFAFVEQINHSQQFALQMIDSIDHLSQSIISSNKQEHNSNNNINSNNILEVKQVIKLLKSKLPKMPEDLLIDKSNDNDEQYQNATQNLDDTMKRLNEKWKQLHDNLVQWKKTKQMENLQQRQEIEESKKIIKQLLTKQSEPQLLANTDSTIVYEKQPSLWYSSSKHFFALLGLVMVLYLLLSLAIAYVIPPQQYLQPS
ncbi:hypothetical protein PPL_06576 [Heterostelium album PN500]|uniref:Uncharacterized protein n=1 Tax=Heterostelium pallidum (strain ATCC 26659 / Pp 5 / PN500) TaxID=670386 RepID=D3BDJ3_HETP5|nr:hypothetical protein PPL_06576 [Heterostelium album PN500]EFA80538.1 hypothetical protein PPL_06576 [Heterostelium album PN500]|eukprot:XP_020432658.1 hypothetical protein PPL_06576 [Heterostelium album PN500]